MSILIYAWNPGNVLNLNVIAIFWTTTHRRLNVWLPLLPSLFPLSPPSWKLKTMKWNDNVQLAGFEELYYFSHQSHIISLQHSTLWQWPQRRKITTECRDFISFLTNFMSDNTLLEITVSCKFSSLFWAT